ncbi:DUF1120 domain-containing protein [Pseudomonas sp. M5A4_2d]
MQPSRALITAALLLAGVSNVMAASSVDLSVVGVVTPSACTPTLSNNGVVDHGKVSVQDFPESGNKVLPTASLQLVVNCNAPMLMAVKPTDNRAGTALYPWPEYFGLGLASGGEKIGWYELVMRNATADDVPGIVIESVDGQRWSDSENTVWGAGLMRTVGTSFAPLPLTTFKADLDVYTTLTDKTNLPISEEIQIDGSATLDVVYL